MTEPVHILGAQILGEPIDETDDDPAGVFAMTAAAADADARKLLLRAGIYSPTPQQLEDAKESARIQYAAAARDAIKTGSVRP
jgi:hypothetical protein